jgi:hypothetical protein
MELMSSDDQHKMVQGAATEAPIATSLLR